MSSISYSLIVKENSRVRSALSHVLGSLGAADVALRGMRLQAKYGSCFASAAWLGQEVAVSRYIKRNGVGPHPDSEEMAKVKFNAKTLAIRYITQMRDMGLVTTVRRTRPDKKQGTNLVDFTALWRVVEPIVRSLMQTPKWHTAQRVMRAGVAYIAIRIQSIWETVRIDMPPIPPPVEDGVKKKIEI